MSPVPVVADLLTAARLAMAVVLTVVLWPQGGLSVAAVFVSAAWVSDVLDGRLARYSGGQGRLGRWDLTADTAVGAGVVVGLAVPASRPVRWVSLSRFTPSRAGRSLADFRQSAGAAERRTP